MSGIISSDDIPVLSPIVEDYLLHCLEKEVAAYTKSFNGTKCHLCPFRSFPRVRNLKLHLKHHCIKNMFMADKRSPQRAVLRAYFDYCQAVNSLETKKFEHLDLLHWSASKIYEWNSNCDASTLAILQRQNRPVLVRVLTHTGHNTGRRNSREPVSDTQGRFTIPHDLLIYFCPWR